MLSQRAPSQVEALEAKAASAERSDRVLGELIADVAGLRVVQMQSDVRAPRASVSGVAEKSSE